MAGRVDDALAAARAVCERLGLPTSGLDVIRSSSYVAIGIGGTPYVARVGGTAATASTHRREMAIALALSSVGAPVARPAPIGEPLVVDGSSAVGLWLRVPEVRGAKPSATELGSVLRTIHDCAATVDVATLALPRFPACELAVRRLRRLVERGQLERDTAGELAAAARRLEPSHDGPRHGVVHGDFRAANVLMSGCGPVVIDFDAASYGPQAWDLTLPVQQHRRFGLPAADLDAFLTAYGGVADPAELDALCRLRDITSAAWALAMAAGEPAFRPEARRRVASVLDPDDRSPWSWDGLPSARVRPGPRH